LTLKLSIIRLTADEEDLALAAPGIKICTGHHPGAMYTFVINFPDTGDFTGMNIVTASNIGVGQSFFQVRRSFRMAHRIILTSCQEKQRPDIYC